MGHNYGKIPAIYKREPKEKLVTEGIFSSAYLEILKDIKWIGTEKVDGTNFSLEWDGDRITPKGHTDTSQFQPSQVDYMNKHFLTPEFEELIEQNFGEKKVNIYGEMFGKDIAKAAKSYSDDVQFVVFDIGFPTGNGDEEIFARREVVEEISKNLGLEVIPIMCKGTLEELVDFVKTKPKSIVAKKFGRENTIIEGVVARPCVELKDQKGERLITKIKVRDLCLPN